MDLDFSYDAWLSFCKVNLNHIYFKPAGCWNLKGAGLCTFEPCCALSDQRGPRGADDPSLPPVHLICMKEISCRRFISIKRYFDRSFSNPRPLKLSRLDVLLLSVLARTSNKV